MFVFVCLLAMSCVSSRQYVHAQDNSLARVWDNIDLLSRHHTGLSVYDLDKGNWVFNYRDDNYFTPASCTKILTMYASLRYLNEQIPAGYYKSKGDTMVVWGGGDPGTLYPDIKASSALIDFLKSSDKKSSFQMHNLRQHDMAMGGPGMTIRLVFNVSVLHFRFMATDFGSIGDWILFQCHQNTSAKS